MADHSTAPGPLRLIFHIGAGKTGTSSIQQSLRASLEALHRHGVQYLGLMLEHAPLQRHPWQKAGGSEIFHNLPPQAATAQLSEVLLDACAQARQRGCHTLIWSNESFFNRNHSARPVLQALLAAGVDVRIVAYVRRHDAWLRSAYAQWGIKHKTYKGPAKPFLEWIKSHPARFGQPLWSLETQFPDRVTVRNLDAVKDAIPDFMALCGIELDWLTISRDNVTPSNAELLLRALFNSRIEDKVLPERFDQVMQTGWSGGERPDGYMAHLLPSAQDLQDASDEAREDRTLVDQLLQKGGQPPIDTDPLRAKSNAVDTQELVFLLAEALVVQTQKVERLEQALRSKGLLDPGP
ncbi:hypothetical protein [Ideonella livida]|uniref:Sulfotransferase family protein n=1 Tax=Ideonella livida TaxID=2707176 RepID=A0A7C9PG70_9BURK|nr:hypothetical protein [Ideonella livida]NDY90968.1 hypothetical protein [Ideonella livida]